MQASGTVQRLACVAGDISLRQARHLPLIPDSALMTLYESITLWEEYGGVRHKEAIRRMDSLSASIANFAHETFHVTESEEDLDVSSPFVPYCMFQAAVIQRRLWDETKNAWHKTSLDTLKAVLMRHDRRWRAAGLAIRMNVVKYLN